MLSHLLDASIRSLLLVLLAAAVLWSLRGRRTAALRHAVWTSVVCGMLALFALGSTLPRLPIRVLSGAATTALPRAIRRGPIDVGAPATPRAAQPRPVVDAAPRATDWNALAVWAYGAVAFGLLARFVAGIFLAARLRASARPIGAVFESARISVPLTVGWLRPRVLLPLTWREWDQPKLNAVLAHEGAHARRRDGLASLLTGVNRCLFWFHPLAWFLERKVSLAAEQACDEACVAELGDPRHYASLLLDMAMAVDLSQGRLRRHALTMASRSHLAQRVESLLHERRTFSRGLTSAAWLVIAACAIPLVWGAAAMELAPAQSATPQASTSTPRFDVASIRPCSPGDQSSGGRGGKGTGGGGYLGRSPGRIWITCMSMHHIIETAFVNFNDDPLQNVSKAPFDEKRLRGGPAWTESDRYSIEATTSDPVANGPVAGDAAPGFRLMAGPMLRALLMERLQLKLHRETDDAPMYALTIAKGGLKLKPTKEGDCVPFERGAMKPYQPGDKPPCGWIGWGVNGPNRTIDAGGMPLRELAEVLGDLFMDRHVIDRTNTTELFNFHLEYAPDETTPNKLHDPMAEVDPSSPIPVGASVYAAVERQLGLKLESVKGPRGYLQIDHVERPSEN